METLINCSPEMVDKIILHKYVSSIIGIVVIITFFLAVHFMVYKSTKE